MDLIPVELLTSILSFVPCSNSKQALMLVGKKWAKAIQSQNAHVVRWEPEKYVPCTDDRLGYWTSRSSYSELTFCRSRLLRFDQHVVLKACYLPDISPSRVTSVELKMDLGKAAECPVFPKVTRVEVAQGFKFNDLHHFFPNLEVLKFDHASSGAILVLEDLCKLLSLRLIDSDAVWLDCQKLPVGCEVIVYMYNLFEEVSNPSQHMTNLSHHLAFVTVNDDTFDLAIFCDCVNLKQLNLVWNGMHDLQVDGLAELPISVAVFMGISWIYVNDVDGSEAVKERMRHMLSHTLIDAIMLGWGAKYFKQDV